MTFYLKPLLWNKLTNGLYSVDYQSETTYSLILSRLRKCIQLTNPVIGTFIHTCRYFISWVLFVKRSWGIRMLRTYLQEPGQQEARYGLLSQWTWKSLIPPLPSPPLLVSLSNLRSWEPRRTDFLQQERCKEESSLWSIQIGNQCLAWGLFYYSGTSSTQTSSQSWHWREEWRSWAWRVLTSNRSF